MSKPVKKTSNLVKRPDPRTASFSVKVSQGAEALSPAFAQTVVFNVAGVLAQHFRVEVNDAMGYVDRALDGENIALCTDYPEIVETRVLNAREGVERLKQQEGLPAGFSVSFQYKVC